MDFALINPITAKVTALDRHAKISPNMTFSNVEKDELARIMKVAYHRNAPAAEKRMTSADCITIFISCYSSR